MHQAQHQEFTPKKLLLKSAVFKTPTFIVYDYCKRATGAPTLLALHGLASDCLGSKIEAALGFCASHRLNSCRFDYPGHGQSGGKMTDFTLSQALEAALKLVDDVIEGDVLLMGSSTGAWLALRLAQERPERIKGILSIANACDFTEDLYWQHLSTSEKKAFKATGKHVQVYANGFTFEVGYSLIEDGRTHLLFGGRSQQPSLKKITCPMRLLHGLEDVSVPWQTSLKVAQAVGSQNITLTLVPNADHQFSTPENLEIVCRELHSLL